MYKQLEHAKGNQYIAIVILFLILLILSLKKANRITIAGGPKMFSLAF